MKKVILILIAITAIAAGCQKYEEGPCISFHSAKYRIYGWHKLTEYTVDGVDSLSHYYDSLGLIFQFIHDRDNGIDVCIIDQNRKDGKPAKFYWTWELINNNKTLKIKQAGGGSIGVGVFKEDMTPDWEIIKLKLEQMKLKTMYDGKEYKIVLDLN